jgi:membrane-associated phospholipid phosphatase
MHRAVLGLVAALGEPVPLTLMAAALIVTCLLARRWRGTALVAIAVPAAAALGEKVLKPLVARRLGTGTGSFPSGHAVGMFALATAACLLLAGSRGRLPRVARALLALGAVVVAILVPLAMVGLNHHYFTDAVGGAAVGIAVVVVTAFILDAATRRRPRQPARADAPAGRWPEPVR